MRDMSCYRSVTKPLPKHPVRSGPQQWPATQRSISSRYPKPPGLTGGSRPNALSGVRKSTLNISVQAAKWDTTFGVSVGEYNIHLGSRRAVAGRLIVDERRLG